MEDAVATEARQASALVTKDAEGQGTATDHYTTSGRDAASTVRTALGASIGQGKRARPCRSSTSLVTRPVAWPRRRRTGATQPAAAPSRRRRPPERPLLQLDGGAGPFELRLCLLGVFLADLLQDGLGGAVDQVLGLLQPEVGEGADFLDDLDLLVAGPGEHDVELVLLLFDGLGRSGAGADRRRRPPPPGRRR